MLKLGLKSKIFGSFKVSKVKCPTRSLISLSKPNVLMSNNKNSTVSTYNPYTLQMRSIFWSTPTPIPNSHIEKKGSLSKKQKNELYNKLTTCALFMIWFIMLVDF